MAPEKHTNKQDNDNELIIYRLDQIQPKVEMMSEILTKLNTKLEAGAFTTINCPIHAKRIIDVEMFNKDITIEVEKLKAWKYKVAGALIVITFVLNLFAGPIGEKLFGRTDTTTVEFVDK